MADPGLILEIGTLSLRLGKRAWDIVSGNGELGKFFRELGDAVDEDHRVPTEVRGDLSRLLSVMGTNPDFLVGAQELLDGDASASERMRPRVLDAVVSFGVDTPDVVADAIVDDLHRAANRAKRDDRDAAFLQTQRIVQAVEQVSQQAGAFRVITLDDAPAWVQRALRELAEKRPAEYADLEARTRAWQDRAVVFAMLDDQDSWARLASCEASMVLTRLAESWGDWPRAVKGWRKVIAKSQDPTTALVQGSVAASMAGNHEARDELLATARARSPNHPRVILETTGDLEPAEVLEALERVTSDDPKVEALIECRRALAYLHLGRTDLAADALEKAQAADAEMLQVLALGINVDLQRYRDSSLLNAGTDAEELGRLSERALELRERFLEMARHREACRLLMMASDALALAGRRDEIPELIARATDAERRIDNGDHVLAEAALRASQPAAALAVLWPDGSEDEERLRIVGQARSLSTDAQERATGLEVLDRLIQQRGEEARHAAAIRLLRCMQSRELPWSDAAEQLLAHEQEYRWLVRDAKALWLADNGHWEAAEAQLLPEIDDPVAREALLQVYWLGNQHDRGAALARRILESGPQDHGLRVKCALALRRAGDFERVRAEMGTVARDPRGPDDVRRFAFRVWFDDTDPDPPVARFEILETWRQEFPDDPDLKVAWARMDTRLRG